MHAGVQGHFREAPTLFNELTNLYEPYYRQEQHLRGDGDGRLRIHGLPDAGTTDRCLRGAGLLF